MPPCGFSKLIKLATRWGSGPPPARGRSRRGNPANTTCSTKGSPAGPLALACLLLAALGCGGSTSSGDLTGPVPDPGIKVRPTSVITASGSRVQFSVQQTQPWPVIWDVQPPTAGTIDSTGLFVASAIPGLCTVRASSAQDQRYFDTASVTVTGPPIPATISPTLTQAIGTAQRSVDGSVQNRAFGGEDLAVRTASSADGTLTVRHGFNPAATKPGP